MAAAIPALIGAAGAIGGGLLSKQGSKNAANASSGASQAGIDEQRRQFNAVMQLMQPQVTMGTEAQNALARLYGFSQSAVPNVANLLGGAAGPTSATGQGGSSRYPGDNFNFNARSGVLTSGDKGFTPAVNFSPLNPLAPPGLPVPKKVADLGTKLSDPFGLFGKKKKKRNTSESAPKTDPTTATNTAWNPYNPETGYGSGITAPPGAGTNDAYGIPGTIAGTGKPDLSGFFASPDYEFRRGEGLRGLEQSAAARGGAFSGNALRDLADFNSNIAAGEYGNFYNRLASMAGMGQTAVQNIGGYSQNNANSIANLLGAQGNARASGIQGGYNALGNSLQDLAGLGMLYYANRGR